MLVKSKLKYIQSLGHKKSRDESGVFIAEGPKLVKEFLEEVPDAVLEIYALKEWIQEYKKLLTKRMVHEISEPELERITQFSTKNKVLAVIKKFSVPDSISLRGKVVLALDTIQDPGNLGTIIRTADWFGIKQVVCSNDCADLYNPKVVQATMGSIARVQVFYVDLLNWLSQLKNPLIYAAVLDGQDINTIKKIEEGLILIGNESKGIHDALLKIATQKITIPKKGRAESLNAAVAAGIILERLVE